MDSWLACQDFKPSPTEDPPCRVIELPAKREIRTAIRFLTARNISAADIHRQITEVYSTEAMSDSKIRKWVRKFKEG
ncbi:hypothetical protein TNCV_3603491 [Trichonephila clavipes]|nr:hypothetical protein TNCV_3603491 [Trichonephila clavipes]